MYVGSRLPSAASRDLEEERKEHVFIIVEKFYFFPVSKGTYLGFFLSLSSLPQCRDGLLLPGDAERSHRRRVGSLLLQGMLHQLGKTSLQ